MYQFDENWRFTGLVSRSDADSQNRAYKAELRYKKADIGKPGSWAMFGSYVNIGANGIWRSADPSEAIWVAPSMFQDSTGQNLGVKGWSFETAYVPARNTLLRAVYGQYKEVTGTSVQGDTNIFQLQFEMFW